MGFKFDPDAANSSWPNGQYDAVIETTEEAASKKTGDAMLVVTYEVFHPTGKTQKLKDYFVAPGEGKGNLFKLRALCMALGDDVYKAFRSGDLDHKKQLRGRNVTLMLKQVIDPQFGDQNKIEDYTPHQRAAVAQEDDELVPF